MSFFSDLFGGSKTKSSQTTKNDWQVAPEYSEATGARASWWDALQKWGKQPGYGAIAPDWNSIWDNSRQKVQRYFGGGPEGPGLNATVKAGLARRGVSEQPAADSLMQRSGFQQGNQLQDMAVQQAIQEAQFGEKGRQDWIGQLMQLAGLKPQMLNAGSTSEGTQSTSGGEGWDLLGNIAGLGVGMWGMNQQNKTLDKLLSQNSGGGYGMFGLDTGIGDLGEDDMFGNLGLSWN